MKDLEEHYVIQLGDFQNGKDVQDTIFWNQFTY